MDVVASIDIAESCIHNYLCIYVNLCQNLKIIGLLINFIFGYLIVHCIKPVNIFKIIQILCNLEQNIDLKFV